MVSLLLESIKKASSIIFDFEDISICDLIEKKLSSLTVKELLSTCDNSLSSCTSCVGDEEPSIKGILRASSALVGERFIKK